MIKTADWVLDLGPEGGDEGGRIIAEGTPEQVARDAESHTGAYLIPLVGVAPEIAPKRPRRIARA